MHFPSCSKKEVFEPGRHDFRWLALKDMSTMVLIMNLYIRIVFI